MAHSPIIESITVQYVPVQKYRVSLISPTSTIATRGHIRRPLVGHYYRVGPATSVVASRLRTPQDATRLIRNIVQRWPRPNAQQSSKSIVLATSGGRSYPRTTQSSAAGIHKWCLVFVNAEWIIPTANMGKGNVLCLRDCIIISLPTVRGLENLYE